MQTLWVMRHGLAVDQFESDFSRALSEVGQMQAENVARQILSDNQDLPQRMLVSPFTRTQQTAQKVHAVLGIKQAFENEDLLVHYGDFRVLGDYLMTLEAQSVMIISHMPIVAQLCEYLSPGCHIGGFDTAQAVKLQAEPSGKMSIVKSYICNQYD